MLINKKVLFIIGGGISAYKSLEIIRLLQKKSIEVVPVLTKSASEFVTSLSVAALSKKKVHQSLFDLHGESEIGHIQLSRAADIVLVAPATANLMSKMANGHADDLASTLLLATDKKVLIAPAMNIRMWQNPATKRNLQKLQSDGHFFVGPNSGDMACGEFGPGRMAEPEEIVSELVRQLTEKPKVNPALHGKRILVTSGPTVEPIDPIRFISNHSSGKQGVSIAKSLASFGAEIIFITGPSNSEIPKNVKAFNVRTAQEMYQEVFNNGPYDVAICVAAVSDWRVETPQKNKIKKESVEQTLTLKLVQNPDILKDLSNGPIRPKLVIGFAAETTNLIANAKAKLRRKNCDWILANDLGENPNIIGSNQTKISFVSQNKIEEWPNMSKFDLANRLSERINIALQQKQNQ